MDANQILPLVANQVGGNQQPQATPGQQQGQPEAAAGANKQPQNAGGGVGGLLSGYLGIDAAKRGYQTAGVPGAIAGAALGGGALGLIPKVFGK
jgi:hypothetical protein